MLFICVNEMRDKIRPMGNRRKEQGIQKTNRRNVSECLNGKKTRALIIAVRPMDVKFGRTLWTYIPSAHRMTDQKWMSETADICRLCTIGHRTTHYLVKRASLGRPKIVIHWMSKLRHESGGRSLDNRISIGHPTDDSVLSGLVLHEK